MPHEQIIAVWRGPAPLPSSGAVISFTQSYFEATFGTVDAFKAAHLNRAAQIVPVGGLDVDRYQHIIGGFVPAVIDGRHLYAVSSIRSSSAASMALASITKS